MISLYVHVPFCRSRCAYCDFLSFSPRSGECRAYVDALISELSLHRGAVVRTLYIGGGTPTFLEERELARLLEAIRKYFILGKIEEYTVEANPESLSRGKIELLRDGGVRRVSVGVQCFDDGVLRTMGRPTRKRHIRHAVSLLRSGGIDNIGMDLILGIQSKERYEEDIEDVLR